MAEKISGRLQTPVDDNGKRKDIHLITTTDEVITADGEVLTDKLEQTKVQITANQPDFSCIWFKPKSE